MSEKLDYFYSHEPWITVRKIAIERRRNSNGDVISDYDGNPIPVNETIIVHHHIELTDENVDDANISLNQDNLRVMTLRQHNAVHERFEKKQAVYVVFGCDIDSLHRFVDRIHEHGDLVIDVTRMYNCFCGGRDQALKNFVLEMHRDAIGRVENRYGDWRRAFVLGGYPRKYERERLIKRLGAEIIFVVGNEVRSIDSMTDNDIRCYYTMCVNGKSAEEKHFVDKWFSDMGWRRCICEYN